MAIGETAFTRVGGKSLDEEILWFHKSRSQWVQCGDKDMKYFITRAIIEGKQIRIEGLKTTENERCFDTDKLKQFVFEYLREFYRDYWVSQMRPRLSRDSP